MPSGASNAADRGRGAAGRPAGDPAQIPRVVRRPERGVLGGRPHRELVHVRLAENDDPGAPQPRSDRRVEGARQPSRIFDPQVVGMSVVVKRSLSASGTPASGPSGSPELRRASTERAAASATSGATCRNARTCPSTASIRSRCALVTLDRRCLARRDGGSELGRRHPGQLGAGRFAGHRVSPRPGSAGRGTGPARWLEPGRARPGRQGSPRSRRRGTRW